MAINGEKDMQVPAQANLDLLRNLLPDNGKNLIKGYPGKNHLFQNCSTGSVNEYESIEETISQDVLEDITGWINGL